MKTSSSKRGREAEGKKQRKAVTCKNTRRENVKKIMTERRRNNSAHTKRKEE